MSGFFYRSIIFSLVALLTTVSSFCGGDNSYTQLQRCFIINIPKEKNINDRWWSSTWSALSFRRMHFSRHLIMNDEKRGIPKNLPQKLDLFRELIDTFQGDFDNYNQFEQNTLQNITPGIGGGHEHIHATLIPLTRQTCDYIVKNKFLTYEAERNQQQLSHPHLILAAYYLEGIPSKIFRFRLYALEPTTKGEIESDESEKYFNNFNGLLKIYSIDPLLMTSFKAGKPSIWEKQLLHFTKAQENNASNQSNSKTALFEYLRGCDVLWTSKPDLKRHSYLFTSLKKTFLSIKNNTALHAIMINEDGAVLNSTMKPGSKIRVKDELSLWENELWLNDRGFDVESGEFIYGNRKGIPYKMERVAKFAIQKEVFDLKVPFSTVAKGENANKLLWTLGLERTECNLVSEKF